MPYTETKTTGYGTRVASSFKGIVSGLILIGLGTLLLWWNEGRAVKTDKMLNEAQKVCIEMDNPSKVAPEFEGELVCATAMATTDAVLTDTDFGLSENAIGLRRHVEYFQYVEHAESKSEDKLGGKEVTTTTYTYSKEWSSRPIDSGTFADPAYQDKNFTVARYENAEQWAEDVSFGAYKLTPSLIQSMSSKEAIVLNLSTEQLSAIEKAVRDVKMSVEPELARMAQQTDNKAPVAQPTTPTAPATADSTQAVPDSVATIIPDSIPQENTINLEYIHQQGNILYLGRTPVAPQVGDVRITFEKVVPAKVTIIAEVKGNTFKPFKAKNGKTFQTLVMGKKSADEIFDAEHQANNIWLWVLRIIGILLVVFGLRSVFSFLETILKVVPFLANIMGWGIGIVCWVVGLTWSIIIIALAWLFYRPLIGISLLVVAGLLIWLFAFKGKDKIKAMRQSTPEAAV